MVNYNFCCFYKRLKPKSGCTENVWTLIYSIWFFYWLFDALKNDRNILKTYYKISKRSQMSRNIYTFQFFLQETLEMCARETEFKSILFALCYFHAVVCERRKFGAQGWNRVYPYNTGDLTISVNVLYNYLEANPKVRWSKCLPAWSRLVKVYILDTIWGKNF